MSTLINGVALFLQHNCSPANVIQWAKTLCVSPEEFKAEVERQQSIRSLGPTNSFEVEGK